MALENAQFYWNSEVTELIADKKLVGIRIKNRISGEEITLDCDGLFVSIGRKPVTAFLDSQLELDESGYILADESTQTSIPGVFAVGDVRTKRLRQVVTAVADGAVAVSMAEEYLAGN